MGNDILEDILRLVHTKLLILLLKYINQVTEKCIHNAGVGGSSPPVATISNKKQWPVPLLFCFGFGKHRGQPSAFNLQARSPTCCG
jgi:hypothetical protein